jgi:hypothetical protein
VTDAKPAVLLQHSLRVSVILLIIANAWLALTTFARAALWLASPAPLSLELISVAAHPNRVVDALLPVAWLPSLVFALMGLTGSKQRRRRAGALVAASVTFVIEWWGCGRWIEAQENNGVRRVAGSIAAALRDNAPSEGACIVSDELGAIACTELCVARRENGVRRVQVNCQQRYLRDAIVHPPLHVGRGTSSDILPGGVQFVPGS